MPAAGVSWVGVLPDPPAARRPARADDHPAARDPRTRDVSRLAILWASEPPIYGRFGYGLASRAYAMDVPRSPRALRADVPTDPALRLRLVPGGRLEDHGRGLRAGARAATGHAGPRRPVVAQGGARRPEHAARARSALRCVVAEDDNGRARVRPLLRRSRTGATDFGRGHRRGARGARRRPGGPRAAVPLPVRPGPDGQGRRLERRRRRPAAVLAGEPALGDAALAATRSTCGSSTCRRRCGRGPTTAPTSTSSSRWPTRLCPWNEGAGTWSADGGRSAAPRRRAGRPVDVGHRPRRGLSRRHAAHRSRDGRAGPSTRPGGARPASRSARARHRGAR